jgi:hypothetical protein
MSNHLEVHADGELTQLPRRYTWKYVGIWNDIWVCDFRREEFPPNKTNPEIWGGGSSNPSPKT